MPDNSNSLMHIIDVAGKATPSGWTEPAGTSNIAAKRVAWGNEHLLVQPGYYVVQSVRFRQNPSGSAPLADTADGHDAYGNREHPGSSSTLHEDAIMNETGTPGGVRVTYEATVGSNPVVENWSTKANQIPTQGVVKQDAGPTQSQLNDAATVDTDDVPLSTT